MFDNSKLKMFITIQDCITSCCKSFQVFSCTGSASLPRADWSYSLWAYIALRAIIDVLRASSCMMFEVHLHRSLSEKRVILTSLREQ